MTKLLVLLILLTTLPIVCSEEKGEEIRRVELCRTSDGYFKATLGDLAVLYDPKLKTFTTWKDGKMVANTRESYYLKRALEPII